MVTRTGDLTPGLTTTEPVDAVRVEDAERRGDDRTTIAEPDLVFTLAVSDLDFPCKCK